MKTVFLIGLLFLNITTIYSQIQYKYVANDQTIDIISRIMTAESSEVIKSILSDTSVCTNNRHYLNGMGLDSFSVKIYSEVQKKYTLYGNPDYKIVYISTTYLDHGESKTKLGSNLLAYGQLRVCALGRKINTNDNSNLVKEEYLLFGFDLLKDCKCWKLVGVGFVQTK